MTGQQLIIRRPDDWHLHLRDGAMLDAVLPSTARAFGRAVVMPNLVPPILTTRDAAAYRNRIKNAPKGGARFVPLMTLYLTDETSAQEVEKGFNAGIEVVQGGRMLPGRLTPARCRSAMADAAVPTLPPACRDTSRSGRSRDTCRHDGEQGQPRHRADSSTHDLAPRVCVRCGENRRIYVPSQV